MLKERNVSFITVNKLIDKDTCGSKAIIELVKYKQSINFNTMEIRNAVYMGICDMTSETCESQDSQLGELSLGVI